MSSELIFKEENINESVRISLCGEVDIYTSQKLKDRLYSAVEASKNDLVIDCSELNYIDSTGLGILVGTLKKAKQNEKNIHILNVKENIRKLFIITGLDKLFILD